MCSITLSLPDVTQGEIQVDFDLSHHKRHRKMKFSSSPVVELET